MRLSSPLLHSAVAGWLCLVPSIRATPPVPPPPVMVEGAEAPVAAEGWQTEAMAQTLRTPSSMGSPSVPTVTTWTENAEAGAGYVIDGMATSYDLIQSERVAQGNFAFHLAHPDFGDSSFVLNVMINVQPDTKLFFQSKLQWATVSQVAKVQVRRHDSNEWTDTIYSQPGSGSIGEGFFPMREVDLGASYSGQLIMIRFLYDFVGGSAYTGTASTVGWLIDNIQVGPSFPKERWDIGAPTPSEVLYLEYVNRARSDALTEASRLAALTDPDVVAMYDAFGISRADIETQFQWYVSGCMVRFAQPLAFQAQLMETARKHSQDMFANQFQSHASSFNPVEPFQPGDTFSQRLDRVGYAGAAGENVFAFAESVEHGHAGFDVDWGNVTDTASVCYQSAFDGQGMQNPAGHRINIHDAAYNEAGIGVINGINGGVGPQIVTQDFGGTLGIAYITGLIYEDSDQNGFYSAASDSSHEGRGGVRVDVAGSGYYALSTASGAYAIPVVENGTYNVSFSAPGMRSFTTSVAVANGLNVKLDHQPVDLTGYEMWAAQHGVTGGPLEDDDHDGVINRIESAILGMNPIQADAWKLPTFGMGEDGRMRFTIDKHPDATDVEFEVRVSSDLTIWYSAEDFPGITVEADDATQLEIAADITLPALFSTMQITVVE